VAAHVQPERGAHNGVAAGVASIEHAWRIKDEDLALAMTNGVVLVSTGFPERILRSFGMEEQAAKKLFAEYVVDSYTEGGVPAKVILQAMTTNAARLLKVEKQRGAIRPSLAADIVATAANPPDDIAAIKRVVFVMRNGEVVRR
jgi:imidazolonepropionase-like amidohydrolase